MRSERAQQAVVLVAMVLAAVATNGCSGGKGFTNPFASTSKAGAPAGKACYAGVDALAVLDAPKAGANVVGRLALHQKLVRTRTEGGFAYVRAARGGLEGWVPASRLLWKLPAAPAAAGQQAPAGAEATVEDATAPPETTTGGEASGSDEPAAGEAPATPGTKAPEPAQPPPPRPAPKARTGASVFDPY